MLYGQHAVFAFSNSAGGWNVGLVCNMFDFYVVD